MEFVERKFVPRSGFSLTFLGFLNVTVFFPVDWLSPKARVSSLLYILTYS